MWWHTYRKPDFVFWQNRWVRLNQLSQFSWPMAVEVCASAVVMLDTPCSEVVWRVLATHSTRQFPLHFPTRASQCAITFQLESKFFVWAVSPYDSALLFCQFPTFQTLISIMEYAFYTYIQISDPLLLPLWSMHQRPNWSGCHQLHIIFLLVPLRPHSHHKPRSATADSFDLWDVTSCARVSLNGPCLVQNTLIFQITY